MAVVFKDGITQDTSSGKIYSVGDTTGNYNSPAEQTRNVTPSMSLNDARSQADSAFSGLVSPMSLADIRAREAEQKAASEKSATAQFNPQIAQEQKSGMATVSTAQGVTGQNQGFNISTAEAAYLAGTQQEVSQRIKYVEDQKAAAINTGNLAAIQRADDQITKLNEYNNQLTIAKANYALQLMSGNREQAQLELATQSQKLQAERDLQTQLIQQESLKLDAYKTALSTPVGKSFEVNGTTYKGMADLSGIDPANISLSTDDNGYETGIDKTTGKVLWKSEVPTGKTKTQASNITVNMKESAAGARNPLVLGGKQIGWQSYNEQTGKPQNFNMDGSVMTALPTGVQISTFGSGNTTPKVDAFGYPIEE